jgi:hypothetical protein
MRIIPFSELIAAAADLDPCFEKTEYSRGMVELISTVIGNDDTTEELVMKLIAAEARYQKLLAEKNALESTKRGSSGD